jgi:hypothetical protein
MTLHDFLLFSAIASAVAIVAHWFVRGYWLAVLLSAVASSLINIGHELFTHDFAVRPSDAVFWLPMLLVMGIVFALPVVAIIGIPFYVIRRRRQSNAA